MIRVEQAVYGSAQTRTLRGYQMIAQSPGINDALVSSLVPWAPTRQAMASDAVSFESLNAFIAMEQWLVVSRSVFGRPEYSRRGELETSTRFLMAPLSQLEGYGNNALWLARTALSLGHLRMHNDTEPKLESIFLPSEALIGVTSRPRTSPATDHLIRAVAELMEGRQVVLVGVEDERDAIEFVLAQLHPEDRAGLSFTTGLLPSGIRPFRLHFLAAKAYQARQFSERNLTFIDATDDAMVS